MLCLVLKNQPSHQCQSEPLREGEEQRFLTETGTGEDLAGEAAASGTSTDNLSQAAEVMLQAQRHLTVNHLVQQKPSPSFNCREF